MKINKVLPCGYCKGVVSAINLVKQTRKDNPNEDIYILGMIVHNKHVVKELESIGIKTLDTTNHSKEELINSINKGIVILTAHGTPNPIKELIVKKGLKLVDATCKDVLSVEDAISKYINQGYQVLYYGIKDHPESIAALSISKDVILIEKEEDIDTINIKDLCIFISQTTMSLNSANQIYEKIKNKYPNIKYIKGTCNATDSRQNAIKNIKDCDILYIIGDKLSNNTNKLKDIAIENGIKKVFLIDNKNDINKYDLKSNMNIYVSAGASTPPYLIDETIEYLNTIL